MCCPSSPRPAVSSSGMPAECARVGGGGRGWYRGGLPARGLSPLTHPLGGVTCCTCHGLARCVSYYGSVLPPPFPPSPVWGGLPVVLVVGWLGACPTGGGLSDVARSDGDTSPHNATRFQNNRKKCDVGCGMCDVNILCDSFLKCIRVVAVQYNCIKGT